MRASNPLLQSHLIQAPMPALPIATDGINACNQCNKITWKLLLLMFKVLLMICSHKLFHLNLLIMCISNLHASLDFKVQ